MAEVSNKIQQPVITKYLQPLRSGIQQYTLSRYAIGYVLKGKKYIYYGDTRYEVNKGEMFYMNIGSHYIEDVPESGKTFEQITFFYSPEMLSDILNNLSRNFSLEVDNNHLCLNCQQAPGHVAFPAWATVKNFFSTMNQYLKEDVFNNEPIAEKLKTTELIFLIMSNPECCIKTRILNNVDSSMENFDLIIRQNVFTDLGVEELAKKCNKSLTSFKKEFRKRFNESPHKWLIKKRLTHSRLLLMSSNKSIAVIGAECNFPNTSHFIKLFKKEYGVTPASYRQQVRNKINIDGQKIPEIAEK